MTTDFFPVVSSFFETSILPDIYLFILFISHRTNATDVKETRKFYFFCNTYKSVFSPNNSKKSKNTFQWLELITVMVNFLNIVSLKKKFTSFIQYLENMQESKTPKVAFWKNYAFLLIPFCIDNKLSKKLLRIECLINYWLFCRKNACFSTLVSSFRVSQAGSFILIKFSFFGRFIYKSFDIEFIISNFAILISFDRVELTNRCREEETGTSFDPIIPVNSGFFESFSSKMLQVFIKWLII